MLVTSLIPMRIKSQFQKLNKLQYWQNLGNNLNFAIFCSIVHYFLNQKNYHPIQKFLNISEKSLTEDSYQLKQLIIQSLGEKNPIQHFFRNLQKVQKYIQKIEQLLDELCKIHLLIKNQKPSFNSIAIFLQIEINFLHNNEKLGRGLEQISLIKNVDDFYFIIPLLSIKKLPQYQCVLCQVTQHCINMICRHQICLNCIQTGKLKSKENFFLCMCGQIILKNQFLEDAIQEIQDLLILNAHHKQIKEYYEFLTEGDQLKIEQKNEQLFYSKLQQNYIHLQEIKKYDSRTINSSSKLQGLVPERSQKRYDNNIINYQNQRLLKSEVDSYDGFQGINQQYLTYQGMDNRNIQPNLRQSQDHFYEEKSKPFDLMSQLDNQQSQYFQEKSQPIQNLQCSYCLSPFDEYNLKQDIGCSKHIIGACCVSGDYKNCPQCEKVKESQHQIDFPKKQFEPEKMNFQNQTTVYFGNQYNYKKQTISTPVVSSFSRRDPTIQAFNGNTFYERQTYVLPVHHSHKQNKEYP